MELVAPKDKDFMTERIDVPRRYHRALLGESSIFIHDIERKSACKVRFPDRELAEDYVDIFGPDAQVHIAAAMLLEHVPFEAEMTVPPSPELPRVINTPHFADFAEGIKRELHVTVVPQLKNGNEQSVFKFRCQRSNADYLSPAKELLESYLLNHNIQIYVTQAHKRADSFADTFSHFNSRVLANPNTKSYMERRIRLANSTPDVKTLLERSVSYVYANQDIKDGDDGGLSARYSNMSLQGGDYVPPPPVTKGRTGLINAPREDDELLKRGSDSLLEAKLREIARQKQQAIRTQSLDLSLVLARIVEGSSDEQTSHFGHYNGAANTGGGEAAQQEEGSDGEYESPSSYVHGGYASASYGKGGGANGPGVIGSGLSSPTSPLAGGGNAGGSMMTPGSRMSAPVVLPYLGGPRPHAMRMNSGIAEDVIRGLRGNM
ncbi:hypothetical protein FRC19_002470 [Serendipita sp. 401]|nr:hypothetical protein FRC19_002470 [Serendipita sp. 401]